MTKMEGLTQTQMTERISNMNLKEIAENIGSWQQKFPQTRSILIVMDEGLNTAIGYGGATNVLKHIALKAMSRRDFRSIFFGALLKSYYQQLVDFILLRSNKM